jgi:hypothetical protein
MKFYLFTVPQVYHNCYQDMMDRKLVRHQAILRSKTMKKLILALAMIGFSLPAFAQMTDFVSVDANADGEVTFEEAAAAGLPWTQEQFNAADTDGSGTLSEEEFSAAEQ